MEKQKFLIVGASGNMGQLLTQKALQEGHEIVGLIVGPNDETMHVDFKSGTPGVANCKICRKINQFDWKKFRNEFEGKQLPIILDATSETVVIDNWKQYYKPIGLPVIFETTGIKKDDILGNLKSVFIASPNSCPELMRVLKTFAEINPGFYGSKHTKMQIYYGISESHQGPDLSIGRLGKKNPSTTAKDVDIYLTRAGFEKLYFESIRDEEKQLAMGVKPEHLSGHAWHTYRFMSTDTSFMRILPMLRVLNNKIYTKHTGYQIFDDGDSLRFTNPDESLTFITKYDHCNLWFSHNVNGRTPYVDGLLGNYGLGSFLEKISTNQVFDMFDFV